MKSYQARYDKVLAYIDSHIDSVQDSHSNIHLSKKLSVERLSDVAHLSKFHFHRQFSALYNLSVSAYIKQLKIRRASYLLAFRAEMKVIDIALSCGYESSEAFSRSFKDSIGQSPSSFRTAPDWIPWYEKYETLNNLRSRNMQINPDNIKVNILEIDEIQLAVLEHQGAPETLNTSIAKFIKWRKENKLSPAVSRTFNILYDDPAITDADDYRFDIGASLKSELTDNDYGVVGKSIPAGRYAVVHHIGSDYLIESTVRYLYSQWLEQSGEELRDFPVFLERVSFFPDVAENDMVTDIFLPLK